MTILEQTMSAADRAAIRAPIAEATTFPAEAYTNSSFFALELDKVFCQRWAAMVFEDQIPKVGDAIPFSDFGIPLFAVRGIDQVIRVFHNICAYDGCEVVMQQVKGLDYLRVGYHGWRYDLAGQLIATPYWDGASDSDVAAVPSRARNLVEVSSGTYGGVVFINVSGQAGPFQEFIEPLKCLSPHYDLDQLSVSRDRNGDPWIIDVGEAGVTRANWKSIVENDCLNILHEGHTHELYRQSPDVPRVGDDRDPKFEWLIDGALIAFGYEEDDVPDTYGIDDSVPHVGADPDVRPPTGYFVQVYPNLSIVLHPQFTSLNILAPLAVDKTGMIGTFRMGEASGGPEAFGSMLAMAAALEETLIEDATVLESVQRSRTSPLAGRHFYAPFWDFGHYRLNQLVLDDLEA
ncbi:MAG: Rieske 2Fe-2S domain-containing protein [Actinobacteria bacterium]|nr:Rieske 2Fe-2S domain-containing protein [Actinomycetota bacterium]